MEEKDGKKLENIIKEKTEGRFKENNSYHLRKYFHEM